MIKISPSILDADLDRVNEEIKEIELYFDMSLIKACKNRMLRKNYL